MTVPPVEDLAFPDWIAARQIRGEFVEHDFERSFKRFAKAEQTSKDASAAPTPFLTRRDADLPESQERTAPAPPPSPEPPPKPKLEQGDLF